MNAIGFLFLVSESDFSGGNGKAEYISVLATFGGSPKNQLFISQGKV